MAVFRKPSNWERLDISRISSRNPENMFLNCVRKPAFRCTRAVLGTHLPANSARTSGLNGEPRPCRFTYLCVKEPIIVESSPNRTLSAMCRRAQRRTPSEAAKTSSRGSSIWRPLASHHGPQRSHGHLRFQMDVARTERRTSPQLISHLAISHRFAVNGPRACPEPFRSPGCAAPFQLIGELSQHVVRREADCRLDRPCEATNDFALPCRLNLAVAGKRRKAILVPEILRPSLEAFGV